LGDLRPSSISYARGRADRKSVADTLPRVEEQLSPMSWKDNISMTLFK